MTFLKKNIIANFFGSIWQAFMGLAFLPLYIKFMGVESYGLVGIFITFQAMFSILDMGISLTLTREMARLSAFFGKEQEMRNLVRSLELIYWVIAIFIGIVIVAISPFIARHWIKAGQLSLQTIEQTFLLMGLAMLFQWPASFYSGGLRGLQKQILLNVINVVVNTLRSVGAFLILWLVSPTIQAFFLWQIIASVMGTCLLAFFFWRKLPHTEARASFQKKLIAGVWRFAAGMNGIAIFGIILTQLDKIILSKMLTLEMFGYYMLAGVIAAFLARLSEPVFSAIYPMFTQLVSLADYNGLKRLYHDSCQLVSVMVFPIAVVIAMFSYEVMLIWTQNPVTAEKTYILVTILISGAALNALMCIPGALQFSNGWTKLALYTNFLSAILLVPLIIYMTSHYGAIGGASVWVILNCGYVLFNIYFMHQRLLVSEKWRWYWQDVALPLAATLTTAGIGRFFITRQMLQPAVLFYLIALLVLTILSAAIVTPVTRAWLLNKMMNINK